MKYHVYFNLSNGKVVDPTSLPAYLAILDWKLKIIEIQTCFNMQNIVQYGQDWVLTQVEEEEKDWRKMSWLLDSLKEYICKNLFMIIFKNPVRSHPRFPFITFWKLDKENSIRS